MVEKNCHLFEGMLAATWPGHQFPVDSKIASLVAMFQTGVDEPTNQVQERIVWQSYSVGHMASINFPRAVTLPKGHTLEFAIEALFLHSNVGTYKICGRACRANPRTIPPMKIPIFYETFKRTHRYNLLCTSLVQALTPLTTSVKHFSTLFSRVQVYVNRSLDDNLVAITQKILLFYFPSLGIKGTIFQALMLYASYQMLG
jgi:hypothetical protein